MSITALRDQESPALTLDLARRAAQLQFEDLSLDALAAAKQCLLDWFGVTIAGAGETLTEILRSEAAEDGGDPQASLIGAGKASAMQAALINGSASHALDYDDVNRALGGHPTVPVAAAVLAEAERLGSNGREILTAFVAGYETECRIGKLVMPSHYAKGFHATATIGAMGAAAGCARLMGLDEEATARAIGIAATQAAGLKSQFGTMCKPMHGGKAAQNGLLAARLAAKGFTGRDDILETPQGFADTQSDDFNLANAMARPPRDFYVCDNLFKHHAACYRTHSAIEALAQLRDRHDIAADDVAAVNLHVEDGILSVCNIQEPETGLQIKFSLRHTAAFALAGVDTASIASYCDDMATRPDLVALRRKVSISTEPGLGTLTKVTVTLRDGQSHENEVDVGIPAEDIQAQEKVIAAKFLSLAEAFMPATQAHDLLEKLRDFENLENLDPVMALCAGS